MPCPSPTRCMVSRREDVDSTGIVPPSCQWFTGIRLRSDPFAGACDPTACRLTTAGMEALVLESWTPERTQRFCAIWMRFPHVSSKTAVIRWTHGGPRPRKRTPGR